MKRQNTEAPKQKKSFINPDAVRSTFESAITEQEKLDARREKLEQAKQTLKEEELDTKDVDERLGELKQIESPLKKIPEWTKSTEWIEYNEKAKVALEKAIAAMKEVPGGEAQVQALQKRLDKINKLFFSPKQVLHGLSHVDYARQVKKVLDSMELEGEGSEAKIDAQIEELKADLNIYNEMYKRAANDKTYFQFFQKKFQELYQRRDYLYKMIQKHESLHKEEKNLKNMKRLLAQIELNISDINNKSEALGDISMRYEPLIPSNMRDDYNELKKAYEALNHQQILIKSGIVKEVDIKDLLKQLEDELKECEKKVKQQLEEYIIKASKQGIPRYEEPHNSQKDLEALRQLSFVKFFKDWMLEIIEKLQKGYEKSEKKSEVTFTPDEIQDLRPSSEWAPSMVTLEKMVEHWIQDRSIMKHIEKLQKQGETAKEWMESYTKDKKKLQEAEAESKKGLLGKGKKQQKFDMIAYEINGRNKGSQFYHPKSWGDAEIMGRLSEAIEMAKNYLEENERIIAAFEKLERYFAAEEIKKQIQVLADLKAKLETK